MNSVASLQNAFSNDLVMIFAWVHYLAFDLYVGPKIKLEIGIEVELNSRQIDIYQSEKSLSLSINLLFPRPVHLGRLTTSFDPPHLYGPDPRCHSGCRSNWLPDLLHCSPCPHQAGLILVLNNKHPSVPPWVLFSQPPNSFTPSSSHLTRRNQFT